jgi:hypothetical protein
MVFEYKIAGFLNFSPGNLIYFRDSETGHIVSATVRKIRIELKVNETHRRYYVTDYGDVPAENARRTPEELEEK